MFCPEASRTKNGRSSSSNGISWIERQRLRWPRLDLSLSDLLDVEPLRDRLCSRSLYSRPISNGIGCRIGIQLEWSDVCCEPLTSCEMVLPKPNNAAWPWCSCPLCMVLLSTFARLILCRCLRDSSAQLEWLANTCLKSRTRNPTSPLVRNSGKTVHIVQCNHHGMHAFVYQLLTQPLPGKYACNTMPWVDTLGFDIGVGIGDVNVIAGELESNLILTVNATSSRTKHGYEYNISYTPF